MVLGTSTEGVGLEGGTFPVGAERPSSVGLLGIGVSLLLAEGQPGLCDLVLIRLILLLLTDPRLCSYLPCRKHAVVSSADLICDPVEGAGR